MIRLLRLVVDVEPEEIRALLWSFAYYFCLLAGYFLLRPLRDEMGIAGNPSKLPWMFTATFIAMLLAVPAYSWLVARVPRRRLVPLVYRFFILNLLIFFALWRAGIAQVWVARVFFVWVSVYNLFVVSVFWSVMADTWRSPQGKRLFGFVAAGGSAGAMAGPLVVTSFANVAGTAVLILISAILLEAATQCMRRLPITDRAAERPVGGGVLDGFRRALANPFLLGISFQVLFYAVTTTFIYLEQARLLQLHVEESGTRTQIFALQDLFVNSVTIFLQAGVTGRIITGLGLAVSLSIVPLATFGGFAALLVAPGVLAVAIFQTLRRALHFAFDRPSREVLFTAVPRDDKFKAKSFIDLIPFRGGDVVGAWCFAALGAAAIPVGLPLALAWLVNGILLARAHEARVASKGAST
jgi:AAA family ATP:ADP antiporter